RLPARRVILCEGLHDDFSLRQAAIPGRPFGTAFPDVGFEIFEIAVLVAARYAGASQASCRAVGFRTVAGYRPSEFGRPYRRSRGSILALNHALGLLIRVYPLDKAPAGSATQRTLRFGHDSEHRLSSVSRASNGDRGKNRKCEKEIVWDRRVRRYL